MPAVRLIELEHVELTIQVENCCCRQQQLCLYGTLITCENNSGNARQHADKTACASGRVST